ncbi:hypothetical protein HK104_007038, partial [Borealophlyctis nickersoniae]
KEEEEDWYDGAYEAVHSPHSPTPAATLSSRPASSPKTYLSTTPVNSPAARAAEEDAAAIRSKNVVADWDLVPEVEIESDVSGRTVTNSVDLAEKAIVKGPKPSVKPPTPVPSSIPPTPVPTSNPTAKIPRSLPPPSLPDATGRVGNGVPSPPPDTPRHIYIAFVPNRIRELDIFSVLRPFGPITSIRPVPNNRGDGFFVFVDFVHPRDAATVVREFARRHRRVWGMDESLKIEFSQSRSKDPRAWRPAEKYLEWEERLGFNNR